MKIYTRTGDDGQTALLGAGRVRKDSLRLDAYGTVDEANAALGLLLAQWPESAAAQRAWIDEIQSDLFILGTMLAGAPQAVPRASLPGDRVAKLEQRIDTMDETLTELSHFILPQGSWAASAAHLARAVVRRAERRVVALAAQERVDRDVVVYLNRLSDFLFVLARWLNVQDGRPEIAWHYEAASGPRTERLGSAAKDRMDVTLKKLEQSKENRKTLFEKTSQELAKKKEQAERLFSQRVDQMKKDGGPIEKPLRDLDLD